MAKILTLIRWEGQEKAPHQKRYPEGLAPAVNCPMQCVNKGSRGAGVPAEGRACITAQHGSLTGATEGKVRCVWGCA